MTPIADEGRHGAREDLVLAGEDRAMVAAIRLARRGIGTTHPNPRVGAVVLQQGEVVGRGYHARAGEEHAETLALDVAGNRAAGGTLVTTLEPCAHHGRTPPCTDAIVRAGIRRVVLGMRDPNPLVDGRGVRRLRASGLEVVEHVRAPQCRELNAPYLKYLATGLPWVLLKSMVSLDGRVASESGDSRGLGGEAEQRLCHRLRAEHDVVLIGIGAVLADDPELTVRLTRGRQPLRVVVDSRLRIPPTSRLLATAPKVPLVIATASAEAGPSEIIAACGARIWRFTPGSGGRVPLEALLRRLAREGFLSVLAEGGPTIHTALLRDGLADRVAVGIAPLILGGARAPVWTRDLGRARIDDAIAVGSLAMRRVGRDVWLEGSLKRNGSGDV